MLHHPVIFLVIALWYALAGPVSGASLEVPPPPGDLRSVEHLTQCPDYTVEVRKSGDVSYSTCFVYRTDNYATTARKSEDFVSFTNIFFLDTAIDIRITSSIPVGSVVVRPLDHGVVPVVAGNVITFSLARPRKLSVEINDRKRPLFIFAQAPDVPNTTARYYYPPGSVTNIGLQKPLKTGESVYIAAGAVVEGSFKFDWNSNNITIGGRGILCMGQWPWESTALSFLGPKAMISGATNRLRMEGITLANSTGWQIPIYNSDGNKVYGNQLRNLKLISWNPNSDGIWVNGDNHVVDDCFIFNNDDIVMSHAVTSSTISNMVVWGGPWGRLYMHGQQDTKPVTDHLLIENIHVIGKDGGKELVLMDSNPAYAQTIRNITFRNVRIEQHPQGNGIWMANKLLITTPGTGTGTRTIQNLRFENVTLDGMNTDEGDIYGSATSPIQGITFRNLHMAGTCVTSLAEGRMDKNDYATGIVFERTAVIGVADGSDSLADSGTSAFGPVGTVSPVTRTYTIRNRGCGTMTLTGNPRIALSGAGYALTSDAAATVGPGATTSFRITFSPSTAGTYSGSAGIASNDPDKSAFTFALTGTGVQEMQDPPVMTVQPMATPERLALP